MNTLRTLLLLYRKKQEKSNFFLMEQKKGMFLHPFFEIDKIVKEF